jgi:hypothetical protein
MERGGGEREKMGGFFFQGWGRTGSINHEMNKEKKKKKKKKRKKKKK